MENAGVCFDFQMMTGEEGLETARRTYKYVEITKLITIFLLYSPISHT